MSPFSSSATRADESCFGSQMVLPLADIISVEKQRSYTLGYSGLCIVIKGYEEVFIEFSSAEKRDKCMRVLRAELEAYDDLHAGEGEGERSGQRQMRDLIDLSLSRSSASSDQSRPAPESGMSSTQLPIMFSSTTSDFVTFRPEHSMRVTCLTIGSRGDVQPYIALCKALKAHGHTCRIATHPEYKDWVEGHGMDFEPVGGDPGDLMQRAYSSIPSRLTATLTVSCSHDRARLFHDCLHARGDHQVPWLARRPARV